MKKLWSHWGAVIIIFALFIGSTLGQWATQWIEFAETSSSHGEAAELSSFIPQFLAATFENWQSEFLQLTIQAILIASVLQSKLFRADYSADKEDIARLEAKLDKLTEDKGA